jgi:hypothetical protein
MKQGATLSLFDSPPRSSDVSLDIQIEAGAAAVARAISFEAAISHSDALRKLIAHRSKLRSMQKGIAV